MTLLGEKLEIKYGEDVLGIDLEKFGSLEDFLVLASSLKPQKTIKAEKFSITQSNYMKFDFLTEKEIAYLNAMVAVDRVMIQLENHFLSPGKRRLMQIAKMMGIDEKVEVGPIDPEDFATHAKLKQFQQVLKQCFDTSVKYRLGYDNVYMNDSDGTVYAIRDLREAVS